MGGALKGILTFILSNDDHRTALNPFASFIWILRRDKGKNRSVEATSCDSLTSGHDKLTNDAAEVGWKNRLHEAVSELPLPIPVIGGVCFPPCL